MYLTKNDVRGIATYVRIGLPEDQVEAMTQDLNSIIDSLQPITQYDLDGVAPTFHPIAGLSNVMRNDVVEPGMTQDEALANAASFEDGQFKIPTILDDGGGDR